MRVSERYIYKVCMCASLCVCNKEASLDCHNISSLKVYRIFTLTQQCRVMNDVFFKKITACTHVHHRSTVSGLIV